MSKARLFVVDDAPEMAEQYAVILEEAGYEVRTARDADSAWRGIMQDPPDVVMIDVRMPVTDGIELTRRLRNHEVTRAVPIILVTAHAEHNDVVSGLDAGADEFVHRPIRRNELLARIRTMLRLKASHDNLRRANRELETMVTRQRNCLHEATRFEQLGRMAGRIGHDLNSLLTSIRGFNELARKGDTSKIHKYLENQQMSVTMCQSLAAHLVNFTRHQHPHRAAFSPAAAIDTTLAILSHRFEGQVIEVEIDIDPSLTVWGDEGQFSQVCLNLLSNACDAMPYGGRLTVRGKEEGGWTSIVVSDSGHGIDPADLERIFELAFTTRSGGSGIGLSTAREIVRSHGGDIHADSAPGVGTSFTIELPATRESAASAGVPVTDFVPSEDRARE